MIVDGITLFDDLGLLVEERGRSLSVGGVKLAQGQSPFAFRRFGVDPAIASGPLVTTSNDLIAVSIYLTASTILLH